MHEAQHEFTPPPAAGGPLGVPTRTPAAR